MEKFNLFISRNFGVILLSSALLGLFIPAFQIDTSLLIIVSLATVIFASFFKVTVDKTLFTSDWNEIVIYFFIRFVILPVAVYFLVGLINPFYAVVAYFIMVLPSAVSSPAFSAMNEGSVPLALKILIFTNFVTIVTIPLLSKLILTQKLVIDSLHIFLMMVYTVVVPFILYLPLRNVQSIKRTISKNNPLITALGLMVIFVFSTSKNREIILANPYKVLLYAAISSLIFIFLYLVGYYLLRKTTITHRIAFSVCSGANNIGMGVALTLLFFPGEIAVFFIIAQLAWIFVLIPMRHFYKNALKRSFAG